MHVEIEHWLRAHQAAHEAARPAGAAPLPANPEDALLALRRAWMPLVGEGPPRGPLGRAYLDALDAAAAEHTEATPLTLARWREASRRLARVSFEAGRETAARSGDSDAAEPAAAWMAAHRARLLAFDPDFAADLAALPDDAARYRVLAKRYTALAADAAPTELPVLRALALVCRCGAVGDAEAASRTAFGRAARAATVAWYEARIQQLSTEEP